jgi:hypothetical protein
LIFSQTSLLLIHHHEPALPFHARSKVHFKTSPFSSVIASTFYGSRIAGVDYVKKGIPTLRTADIGDWGQLVLREPPQVRVSPAEFAKWGLANQDNRQT